MKMQQQTFAWKLEMKKKSAAAALATTTNDHNNGDDDEQQTRKIYIESAKVFVMVVACY